MAEEKEVRLNQVGIHWAKKPGSYARVENAIDAESGLARYLAVTDGDGVGYSFTIPVQVTVKQNVTVSVWLNCGPDQYQSSVTFLEEGRILVRVQGQYAL